MSELTNQAAQPTAPVQVQLTVSGILNDLDSGLTRDMIKAKYSLTTSDMTKLFSHPKLKGKKTKPAPSFILVDDTEDEVATPVNEVEVEAEAVAPVEEDIPQTLTPEEPVNNAETPTWSEPESVETASDNVEVSNEFD